MTSSAALIVPPSTSATTGRSVSPPGSAYRARCSPRMSYVATRPPSRKAEAVSTASVTSPPAFPLRSSRTPAPLGASRTASLICLPLPLVKAATLITSAPSVPVSNVTASVLRLARRSRLGPVLSVARQAHDDGGARGGVLGPAGVPVRTVTAQQRDDLGHRPPAHRLAVDRTDDVAGLDPGQCGRAARLDLARRDPAVGQPLGGETHPGVLAVEGLLELLVLTLVVHGAPAVTAAADDVLGGLGGGLPVGHGFGGGPGDLVLVGRGGDGAGACPGGFLVGARQRAGGRGGGEHAREEQCQGRPR